MSFFQKVVVLLQLLSAVTAEIFRLLSSPGQAILVPPEGTPAPSVVVEGYRFELRVHVKRVA
ncbi:MAG: hypothetical protein NZ902_06435 [Acidilobaceae archaeon]|nr:hypothetical protein [Acidilobaceae archaeon]